MSKYTLFVFIGLLVFSCSSAKVWKTSDLQKDPGAVFAVFPFQDANPYPYRTQYPEAAETVRDAFESALFQMGVDIVERSQLEKVSKEMGLAMSGITDSKAIEIGKILNADIIILGLINEFNANVNPQYGFLNRVKKVDKPATVNFTARAVNVEDGKILWKGNNGRSEINPSPAGLAQVLAQELVSKLMDEDKLSNLWNFYSDK